MEKNNREAMMNLLASKPAGQRVGEFCEQNNLTEATYYYWRNRLNKMNKPAEGGAAFAAIRVKTPVANVVEKGGVLASLDFPGGASLSIYDPSVIPALVPLLGQG